MNDALKLSKHLQNRGRPTERTWLKYKEAKEARKIQGWVCTKMLVVVYREGNQEKIKKKGKGRVIMYHGYSFLRLNVC